MNYSTSHARRFGAVSALALALGALSLGAGTARAADLPTAKEPVPLLAAAPADDFQPFFVKLGFTYVLNTSNSRLWSQNITAMKHGIYSAFPAGVGAEVTDVPTLGGEFGVYLTRRISLNVSGGIPQYVNDKTKGFNPANPTVPNGTVLARIMPGLIPITLVYHFDSFHGFNPYVGFGVAPTFSFSNKDAFLHDVHVAGALGPVAQAGFDYMFDRHWGVSLDVKKVFNNYVTAYANGVNVPGVGVLPTQVIQHANFAPWTFSLGLLYRFGDPLLNRPLVANY